MHILLTNDDGPPSDHASPYLKPFVEILTSPPFNHTVSVVIPTQQRSWIGKAHFLPSTYTFRPAGQHNVPNPPHTHDDGTNIIAPTYFNPVSGEVTTTIPKTDINGVVNGAKAGNHPESYWVLVPGTPATCVQLGLFHHPTLFPAAASSQNGSPESTNAQVTPIDLVISGPNFGRNTGASFALSSGTIGGALEAAVVGKRSIAVSFAHYREKGISPAAIQESCLLSAKIIDKLWKEWHVHGESAGDTQPDVTPDLYSINIPLVEGISEKQIQWTYMFSTSWQNGRLYAAVPAEDESKSGEGVNSSSQSAPRFHWKPDFQGHFSFQQRALPGSDTRAIMDHFPSVTPLKADYSGLYGRGRFQGEFRL